MSHCITAVKDANPKIGGAALMALSVLIRKYTDEFRPLANMSFEQLLVKLGDAKVGNRIMWVEKANLADFRIICRQTFGNKQWMWWCR